MGGGGWGGVSSVAGSSEDAKLNVIVCRLNERHVFI